MNVQFGADAALLPHAAPGGVRFTFDAAPGPLHARAALVSPDWLRDGVIYQLSVPAFGGDFDGVRAKLPYLDNLGADVLWIMPIHPVGIARRRGALGDPYAVRDFDAIDRRLGDAAAPRALVDAAHARGMRVLMDWTLNRSSIDHPFTRTHPHWYTRRPDGSVYYAVPDRGEFAGFDFADRALRRALIDSMRGWIERFGFDGLRFDDADITPCNFLDEIRAALAPGVALISQSYDEFHHLYACDLTYEGGIRALLDRIDLQLPARRAAHALAGRQGARPRVGFPGPGRPSPSGRRAARDGRRAAHPDGAGIRRAGVDRLDRAIQRLAARLDRVRRHAARALPDPDRPAPPPRGAAHRRDGVPGRPAARRRRP